MDFNKFQTYGLNDNKAFEVFCTQLFERYLRRSYPTQLSKFQPINGAGGDGGIEAYGELDNGKQVAVQAKWFRTTIGASQIGQIKNSIMTAMRLRPNISEYIVCIPRTLGSIKNGKGGKTTQNSEASRIESLTNEMHATYPSTKIVWWLENELQNQLLVNDELLKFWFEREIISLKQLKYIFELSKAGWISNRYIYDLHLSGIVQKNIDKILYNKSFRLGLVTKIARDADKLNRAYRNTQDFIETLNVDYSNYQVLNKIKENLIFNSNSIKYLITNVRCGFENFNTINFKSLAISNDLKSELADWQPTSQQIGKPKRLLHSLVEVERLDLQNYVKLVQEEANQYGMLCLGAPGTGKTHALAYIVETCLNNGVPAIIIRANGSNCKDWRSLLQTAIDLDDWSLDAILSALEAVAIMANRKSVENEKNTDDIRDEARKVLICVDGLEEDTTNWSNWYERIREVASLVERYPRVRFAFTARPNFYRESEPLENNLFKVINLPAEGDVSIEDLKKIYFMHYKISIESPLKIRGISTPLALRLFCDKYKGRTLNVNNNVLTSEDELIRHKVARIENEFRSKHRIYESRSPIHEAIKIVASALYTEDSILHEALFQNLKNNNESYMHTSMVEEVIECLVDNSIITKNKVESRDSFLHRPEINYTISFQLVIDVVLADMHVAAIMASDTKELPSNLCATTIEDIESTLINQRMVQEVVKRIFLNHGKLIEVGGFLSRGLPEAIVTDLRYETLIDAPHDKAVAFKDEVCRMFHSNYKDRFIVFSKLIYPSSASSRSYFGANFLHEILIKCSSAVARDQMWVGLDRYEIDILNNKTNSEYKKYDLINVIMGYNNDILSLPEDSEHDEYPLIYAWCLSSLNQLVRDRIRVALTQWASSNIDEFILLLDKLFFVNDPQIQEDFSSIMLGLASIINDASSSNKLALWAIDNVFSSTIIHRNIIVRSGFGTIVEKAYTMNAISVSQVELARPTLRLSQSLLPLDVVVLHSDAELHYPIVHDLAWYVIKFAYKYFIMDDLFNRDVISLSEDHSFVLKYLNHYGLDIITPHKWVISAAVYYIKSLGFDRSGGNGSTDETHGAKSQIFTLEEKYTWLAVHYIQGYLSDELPLLSTKAQLINYMKIAFIPNPSEDIKSIVGSKLFDYDIRWVAKESLAPELSDIGTDNEQLQNAIEGELAIEFSKILQFNSFDFGFLDSNDAWLCLYCDQIVQDSSQAYQSMLSVRSVLIEKGERDNLLIALRDATLSDNILTYIEEMHTIPGVEGYCNPSDVIWIKWFEEIETSMEYRTSLSSDPHLFYFTVSRILKSSVKNDEKEIFIPSRVILDTLEITNKSEQFYYTADFKLVGFNHDVLDHSSNKQHMLFVDEKCLLASLDLKNKEVVWFIDLLRYKNYSNSKYSQLPNFMKDRKYLVWLNEGRFESEKLWDARFKSNRDTD